MNTINYRESKVQIDDTYHCPCCCEDRKCVCEYGFSDTEDLIERLKAIVDDSSEYVYNADRVILEEICNCDRRLEFDPGDTAPMRKETAEEILNELI